MTRVFLIGYMGAGKTTLGKAFARSLGLTFVDLDWYLEERFHKTVRQLFTERGGGFPRVGTTDVARNCRVRECSHLCGWRYALLLR